MRKRECIYTHGLLVEVARAAQERNDVPPTLLEDHREQHVEPSAVHRSKESHREAVLSLGEALSEAVDARAETEPPSAD